MLDDVPEAFLVVLQHVVPLDPFLFPAIWYCTDVFLVVGHIYFLCSGHGSVTSLVPLIFWFIFPLSLLMAELYGLDWGVSGLCHYIPCLDPSLEVGPSEFSPLEV